MKKNHMLKPAAYVFLGFVLAMLVRDAFPDKPIFVEIAYVLEPPSFIK
jgi:hypothetical protein